MLLRVTVPLGCCLPCAVSSAERLPALPWLHARFGAGPQIRWVKLCSSRSLAMPAARMPCCIRLDCLLLPLLSPLLVRAGPAGV